MTLVRCSASVYKIIPRSMAQLVASQNYYSRNKNEGPPSDDEKYVITNRDRLVSFKYALNWVFPDIPFTMEEENTHELPFLDVLDRRQVGLVLSTTPTPWWLTTNESNPHATNPVVWKQSSGLAKNQLQYTMFQWIGTHCINQATRLTDIRNPFANRSPDRQMETRRLELPPHTHKPVSSCAPKTRTNVSKINCANCETTRLHDKTPRQNVKNLDAEHQFDFKSVTFIVNGRSKYAHLMNEAWFPENDLIHRHNDLHPG